MRIFHINARRILVIKLVVGGAICLFLASQDQNGLSLRDVLVGGGMVIFSTVTIGTAIEQGMEVFSAVTAHAVVSCILADAVTGLWLNVSPFLDKWKI